MDKLYRLADIPASNPAFNTLPIARGYIDAMNLLADGSACVLGWLLLPEAAMDGVDVHFNGVRVMSSVLAERPDVAEVFSWIPHARQCGLSLNLPSSDIPSASTSILEIVAFSGSTPRARLSHLFRADIDRFPFPPEELTFRVAHTRDPHFFKLGGLKVFGDFIEVARRHTNLSAVRRVLDWGCGCGRVTAHLMAMEEWPQVLGCDIDATAIEWCNKHLCDQAFAVVAPLPPAPYPDAHFNLILSYSVFTHLARRVQLSWLEEMRRLLSPGGLFIATTHGDSAFSFAKACLDPKFPVSGIDDYTTDTTLGNIAPRNYYRGTYQSKDYTVREFSKYFEILEYIERGAGNFQDIVVLRRQ